MICQGNFLLKRENLQSSHKFFLVILGDIRRSLFSMGLGIEDFFRIAFQPSKCTPTCLFLEYTKVFRPERFVTSTTSYEIDKIFSMSQGHLFVSLLFWGLHFIFYRDFSLSVLLVKTSFWNSSRMLKLMIFWYQKFSEKSVQKVTCLKVTHFWEFGRTQNASLFSTTVYVNFGVTDLKPWKRNILLSTIKMAVHQLLGP